MVTRARQPADGTGRRGVRGRSLGPWPADRLGETGTARRRRVDGSLRKPCRPDGRTLGHQSGRGPCALAALKLFAPVLPGLGYGLALATARHGPDHEASPCARHAAGPRTDSDGTSPTAFTTARMGGDCAWTRLPRDVPNRKTHVWGRDGTRVSTSDPRGARARRGQALHRNLFGPRSCRQHLLGHDPISITGNVHTAHNRGITTETVICALTHYHIKGATCTRNRGNQIFTILACWFRNFHWNPLCSYAPTCSPSANPL